MSIIPSAAPNDTTTTVPDEDSHEAAVARCLSTPYTDDVTPDPMTPEREAEIRAREQAATPGPWEECPSYGTDFYAYLGGSYLRGVGSLTFGEGEDAEADRAFTLNARQDVPALLAEIKRLRVELADQTRTTEYFANQSRRRGNRLAADPSRRQVTPVEAFAYDMDQALVDLSTEERRGADLVLQVLRARATAADVPTAEGAS
ncbi:hypothetical protein ABT081_17005 [Streptomyces sp. NPDC002238]|uniref:hypothetical protein n=1 Tax=Streptomyces sp. NPDC002238 TaxID=3156649 RepID=UPI00331C8DF1